MYVLCMFVNPVFSQLIIASIKGVYKNGGEEGGYWDSTQLDQ